MKINELPIGTIVIDRQSLYNQQPIEWIIIDKNHSGYPNNSVTLLTKNTIPVPEGYTIEPLYKDCNLREWLNNIFFNTLSKKMQKNVLLTDIISDEVILKNKLFLPSSTETGFNNSPNEGVAFDYFKVENNRISNNKWWTRTKYSDWWFRQILVSGKYDYAYFSGKYGQLRVACNIRSNVFVDENNILVNNTKFLIKQNDKYYAIKSNFYQLGQPKDESELVEWYEKCGVDDPNEIMKPISNQEISMSKDDKDIWTTDMPIDFNKVTDDIELVENDDKKSIKYGCKTYRIYDLLDDEFQFVMSEDKEK